MKNRRSFLLSTVALAVALVVAVGPAIADELFGVMTKVDVEGKRITVKSKGADKEVEVTVTDDTEWETPKGSDKINLKRVAKQLEKAKEKGQPGVRVVVTHEKAVASKIAIARKKAPAKPQD